MRHLLDTLHRKYTLVRLQWFDISSEKSGSLEGAHSSWGPTAIRGVGKALYRLAVMNKLPYHKC